MVAHRTLDPKSSIVQFAPQGASRQGVLGTPGRDQPVDPCKEMKTAGYMGRQLLR